MQRLGVGSVTMAVQVWECARPTRRPAVLLPGTGLTADNWDVVARDLSQDRTVHAVNLRGHGASDWPGTYSIALMAADVEELLPRLGGRVDLVGHSLGGLVACRVAATSSVVSALVLEDVGLMRPRPSEMPSRPAGDLAFDWAMVEQVRPEIDRPADDWAEVLGRITVPVLAVGGGPSSFVPQGWVADLVDTVTSGTLITIDAGHEIHAGTPAEFISAVRAFLDVAGPGQA